ncbi:hypothetical protein JR316_0000767 [Psilocybe cubensis]|uniref:Uncharacterized protein n=2 Tax=Psilocybe cubensis TaxID=181762 RepID=A0ACB8HGB6_PSICU|nr:hypothetical protein JR316_0000767 [Psilocybe cubensis]KAH9486702.1 hypothetical protein JR316_0000767 [Psilocybe cubensis]
MSTKQKKRPIIRIQPQSAYDKESRDAALRARRLLPSPPDVVKSNRPAEEERQRMNAFKFGNPPSLLDKASLFPPHSRTSNDSPSPQTPPSPLSSAFHLPDDSFAQLELQLNPAADPHLLLKTNDNSPSTPIIVESPVQHRFSQDILVIDHAPPILSVDPPATRKRGMTDSTPRKSLNPFKRDKEKSLPIPVPEIKNSPSNDNPPTLRPRRLTMSASLNNLRRSFIGSLSRSSPSESTSKKSFNASHLPPSPTIPAQFAVQATASLGSRLASPLPSPTPDDHVPLLSPSARSPRPVVMYNRGSILLETANIEDDEVRRMTELAFLG